MQERFLCGSWSIVCWTYPQACDLWCMILGNWPPGLKRITPSRLYWIMWAFWFVTVLRMSSNVIIHTIIDITIVWTSLCHALHIINVISQLLISPCHYVCLFCDCYVTCFCNNFMECLLEIWMPSCVSHQDAMCYLVLCWTYICVMILSFKIVWYML